MIDFRPLESFNDTGLSHDLVRMKYMQYEQKRLMKQNQLCRYMFQSSVDQSKRGKQLSRFEASLK